MIDRSNPSPHRFRILASLSAGRLSLSACPALLLAALLALAAVIGGCGSSSTSTIELGHESPSDTSAIETTTTAKTPTTGPLSTKPVITPPSGPAPTQLQTKDLVVGTGKTAKAGDSVTVNYVGVLYKGGKEFDSSWKHGEPFTFTIGEGVIKGWSLGVAGMRVGGRRELIIPAPLAYGPQGRPPTIPPNSPLIFVVDLLAT
ncbi:MAG TPA: FKBP-type peptidyl-prolyl cis-trans isomerase [Solirubrobacteraceae bacterium]|jgi:peptidylprolyl isomerase|nr:FKBP-type peptidyl-prolyl cis-trans isomerase [Solirubrobacteraceae bacterium]